VGRSSAARRLAPGQHADADQQLQQLGLNWDSKLKCHSAGSPLSESLADAAVYMAQKLYIAHHSSDAVFQDEAMEASFLSAALCDDAKAHVAATALPRNVDESMRRGVEAGGGVV
jgi:hypothetical protein